MGSRASRPKRAAGGSSNHAVGISKASEEELRAALGPAASAVIPKLAELFVYFRTVYSANGPAIVNRKCVQRARADLKRSRKAVSKALSVVAASDDAMLAEMPSIPGIKRVTPFSEARDKIERVNREIALRCEAQARRGPKPVRAYLAHRVRHCLENAGVKPTKYELGPWGCCVKVGLREAFGIHVQSALGTLKAAARPL